MDINVSMKKIKDTFYLLSSKDVELSLKYIGTAGGITKPYICQIDHFRTEGETAEKAFTQMFKLIKTDLEQKLNIAQASVNKYSDGLRNFCGN